MLNLHRVLLLRPAEAPGQTAEMRVHRDSWDPESVAQHHVSGLASDPRQSYQVLEPRRHVTAKSLDQHRPDLDQRVGFGSVESRGLDHRLELGAVRRSVVRGAPVPGKHHRSHHVHPDIGGLSRHHRGHQQLQRVLEVEFTFRVGIALYQLPVDLAGTTGQGDRSLGI